MHVKRIISNNAVVAVRADEEVVVLGRGVGFGRKAGDEVEPDRAEQVFLAEEGADERLTMMLADIPMSLLALAGRIAELAESELGIRPTQSLILPLADHLSLAVMRAEAGATMTFPLGWEVRHLYPAEFQLGVKAVELCERELGVALDPEEAVAVALHLVNVQFVSEGHTEAMIMTETIARVLSVVEQTFSIRVDRGGMSCTRFVTHLRYLFARVSDGAQLQDPHPTLFDAIAHAHPAAMACAAKVQYLIEVAFGATLTLDETGYLGLHIARLLTEHEKAVDR